MSPRQPKSRAKSTKPPRPYEAGPLPIPRELLTAGVEFDAEEDIKRQRRLEGVKAALLEAIAVGRGEKAIDEVLSAMLALERDNDRMAWRILRATRYRFGRQSERLSPDELQQLLLAFGGQQPAAAQSPDEPQLPVAIEPEQADDPKADALPTTPDSTAPEAAGLPPKKKRTRVRAMQIGEQVERNTTVVPLPADERTCALCGREKKVFDYVEHQCIRYVPAKIVVDIERREKAGCGHCRKDVSVAPRQGVPAVVRKVDASLLGKILSQKAVMGLPLDRQRRELARMGLDIPDKTLQSYWSYATDLVEPVAVATQSLVFGSPIVGADDSHLRTLDKTAKHGVFRGHLWCFVGSDGVVGGPESVAYGYTPSWQAEEIADWFAAIDGFIQCDGYAGYSAEVEDETGALRVPVPDDRRLGCAMHVRSKFHAALLAKDRRAAIPLKLLADLYQIEADCKARGLDAQARGEQRHLRSLPLLKDFDDWVDVIHPKLLPKSPLRIATGYAQKQRDFLQRCFLDGRFEIDNGRVERRIRMFAVARRNFLFTGSPRGGERLAVVFTLVDNCLTLGIDPYVYLVDIIGKLERGLPLRQLSSLIPANWALEQPQQNRSQ
jgi:hypothetical protein